MWVEGVGEGVVEGVVEEGEGLLRMVRGLLRRVWVGMEEWREELFWGYLGI